MKRLLRWIPVVAAGLVALYALIGFFAVPLVVRHAVVPRLDERIDGGVELAAAAFNPFTFAIRLEGLTATDAEGATALEVDRLEANLEVLATGFSPGWHFRSAELRGVDVQAAVGESGGLNLAALLPRGRGPLREIPRVVMPRLAVRDARIRFRDATLPEPFEIALEDLDFVVDELDTRPDNDTVHRLAATTDSGARLEWHGTVRADPLTSNGTLRVAGLPLQQGSPYARAYADSRITGGRLQAELTYAFAPAADPRVARATVVDGQVVELGVERADGTARLEVAELRLAGAEADATARAVRVESVAGRGGRLIVQGPLAVERPAGKPAAPPPARGAAPPEEPVSLLVHAVRDLLENAGAAWNVEIEQADLADWAAELGGRTSVAADGLRAQRIAMSHAAREIRIERVAVAAPDVRTPARLLPADEPESEAAPAPEAPRAGDEAPPEARTPPPGGYVLVIGAVAVEAGTLKLRDGRAEPPATIELDALALDLGDVSTAGGTAAPFTLAARLQSSGTLQATGEADLFAARPSGRIEVQMSGVPLKPYDAIAAPWVGYGIERGRMAMTFPATLEAGHFEGEIAFTFDALHLGEKVESPHAPNAPIKLGLDLLRDPSDRIEGRIPISGDITDPSFSFSGLVFDAFLGLVVGAATSPFNLLASLFGGDEVKDISHVDFAPASAQLSDEALRKLDVLAEAMLKRPALRLEAVGHYHPQLDAPAMREMLLRERILARIHERTILIDAVNAAAYRTWVELLYRWEVGPPVDAGGEPLALEVMEAELLERQRIPDKRRNGLARARTEAVVAVLVEENGVAADRIGTSVRPDDKAPPETPRVEFSLR